MDTISTKLTRQDESQKRIEAKFDQIAKNYSSSIHNIKVQLGQLANVVATHGHRNLLSNTETNLKDVKAITLWSGMELKSKAGMESEATTNKDDD